MKDKSKKVPTVKKRKIVDSRSNKQHSDAIPDPSFSPWMEKQTEKPDYDACVLHKVELSAKYLFLTLGSYFLAKLLFLLSNSF